MILARPLTKFLQPGSRCGDTTPLHVSSQSDYSVLNCSHFGAANDGNCGFYNGSDAGDTTAAVVPAGMRAAIVQSDAAYPGSCGRYASCSSLDQGHE